MYLTTIKHNPKKENTLKKTGGDTKQKKINSKVLCTPRELNLRHTKVKEKLVV
jgi:hypothetical protein